MISIRHIDGSPRSATKGGLVLVWGTSLCKMRRGDSPWYPPSSSTTTTAVIGSIAAPSETSTAPVGWAPSTSSGRVVGRGWPRRGRNETRSDPRPCSCSVVVVEGDTGRLVYILFPTIRQSWDHGILSSFCTDVRLLGRGQAHGTLPPTIDVLLVMQLEIFPELPAASLLLAPRGTVMG